MSLRGLGNPSKRSTGEWQRHLVNLWQSPGERRDKYHLVLSLGVNTSWAIRMRDWRLSKIERFFGLDLASLPYQGVMPLQLNSATDHRPDYKGT